MTVIRPEDLSHEDAEAMGFGAQFDEDRPVGVFTRKATSGTKKMWAGEEISLNGAYFEANDAMAKIAGPNPDRLARLQRARRIRISEGIAKLTGAERVAACERLRSLGEPPPLRLTQPSVQATEVR